MKLGNSCKDAFVQKWERDQAEGKTALAKAGKIFLQMFIMQYFSVYKQNAQRITAWILSKKTTLS